MNKGLSASGKFTNASDKLLSELVGIVGTSVIA